MSLSPMCFDSIITNQDGSFSDSNMCEGTPGHHHLPFAMLNKKLLKANLRFKDKIALKDTTKI